MLSKNNRKLQAQKLEPRSQHFTIKKFTIGEPQRLTKSVNNIMVKRFTFAVSLNSLITAKTIATTAVFAPAMRMRSAIGSARSKFQTAAQKAISWAFAPSFCRVARTHILPTSAFAKSSLLFASNTPTVPLLFLQERRKKPATKLILRPELIATFCVTKLHPKSTMPNYILLA